MAPLEWDRCATFALATFAVAVTTFVNSWKLPTQGGGMGWQAVLLLLSAAFLCAALFLAWLSLVRHPSQLRRNATRERARAAAVKAAEQDRLRPIRAAWNPFHLAALKVVSQFYELRGPGRRRPEPITDDEWQNWRNTILDAWKRAEAIEKHLRSQAFSGLERMRALSRENMDAGSVDVVELKDFLMWKNRDFL